MSFAQLIVIILASVSILLIWLVIALLEKIQKQSQAHDLKYTDEADQKVPFSL